MKYSDSTVSPLLRELVAGRDINSQYGLHRKELLREVAWQVFRDAAKAKFNGGKADTNWLNDFISRHTPNKGNGNGQSSYISFLPAESDFNEYDLASINALAVPTGDPERFSTLKGDIPDIGMNLTVQYNGVSIKLTQTEAHIVVGLLGELLQHTSEYLACNIGKRLELPLMLTLAKLYQVPSSHYAGKGLTGESREVDFHFLSNSGDQFFCEVKLMGKGNPESADSTIARRSNIFIAQTLSDKNKSQLTNRGHHWVELGADDGYKRMFIIFTYLDIPCVEFASDLDAALDAIIPQVFAEIA